MKTLTLNQMLVETYVALLRNLSRDTKLQLIARLSQTMIGDAAAPLPEAERFQVFESEQSADALAAEIRQSRVFTRNTETL
ncbi:MAG: hypothetical protein NW241_16530 [Bacteroidia bacterium]|nr:hypothetical protein [Bacteroidia bacterium]